MGPRQLLPGGWKDPGGSRPAPDLLLLHPLVLQLPTKLQIYFFFPVEERMLWNDLEEAHFVVEAPFTGGGRRRLVTIWNFASLVAWGTFDF